MLVHPSQASKILVFDFSNISYIAYHSNASGGNYIRGFFERVLDIVSTKLPGERLGLVFALDHRSKRKYALNPDYKGTRDRSEFDPRPELLKLIRYFKCMVIEHPDEEADDVISSFVARNNHADKTIWIVSRDADMYQLGKIQNINFFDPVTARRVSLNDVTDKFGVDDWLNIPIYKAMFGDPSDNIKPAVPRLKKASVLPLINNSNGVIEAYYESLIAKGKELLTPTMYQRVLTCKEDLMRNYNMVKLSYAVRYTETFHQGNVKFMSKYLQNNQCMSIMRYSVVLAGQASSYNNAEARIGYGYAQ